MEGRVQNQQQITIKESNKILTTIYRTYFRLFFHLLNYLRALYA